MRLALIVPLLLLVAPSVECAQSSGSARPQVLSGERPSLDCPVGFSVHHSGLTATLREAGDKPASQYAQRLQLEFDRTRTPRIARIAIVVRGNSSKAGAMLLVNGRAAEDATQSLELNQTDGRFDPVQYIVTDSVPLITRIEITAVDYQDGTAWRTPSAHACSVAPSLFVLVNATAQ